MAILDTQAVNAVLQHLEPGTWKLLGPRDDRLVPVTAPHSVSYIAVCSPTGVADTLRTFALNTIPGIWEPVRHKSGWNSTWMRVPLAEASHLVAFTDYGPMAQVPLKYDPAAAEAESTPELPQAEAGRKGDKARASRLTPEERSESARRAARARWGTT